MAETTNYDLVDKISVAPSSLTTTATQLKTHAQEIADAIGRIQATLNGLTSQGWRGGTQQEAEDFNRRWLAVMKELFGTEADPSLGVLNAISSGVGVAGGNYGMAENGLNSVWNKFASGLPTADELTGDGGGEEKPDPDKPADVLDTNKTAITADY
ncbi:WXG100 family type VII secretion target [Actinomadura algeriensis]|uniref:Uncharacterized protein YukE n=1 Tax=Actinomadura algeriensis TaxID=1679523 RepID=A0ABR9JTV7_9ACTN|nr:WXG100 family type VII secretion target [Actinomadura algeriensis]MBE1533993.1 uncharacterized protein YukE [Actinomadura algeriensis]